MYSQTLRSDRRSFAAAALSAALCIAAVWLIRCIIKNTLVCDIITFSAVGAVSYKILTGCCGEFTYSVNEENIFLSRRISAKNKYITINRADIIGIYSHKPKKFRICADFCTAFTGYGRCFITYKSGETEQTAVFAPSKTFVENMSALGYPVLEEF